MSKRQTATQIPHTVWLALRVTIFLWIICCGLMAYWRFVKQLPYPYNFPFFPVDHLYDILCFQSRFRHLHSREFFSPELGLPFQYPPAAAILYTMFYLSGHLVVSLFATTFVSISVLAAYIAKRLVSLGIGLTNAAALLVLTFMFSYPLWYACVQANIELILFVLIGVGILSFLSGRFYLAAIIFGYAASAKIFPFVFFALFLQKRRWRELVVGLLAGLIATLLGLWTMCPDIRYAYVGVSSGLASNKQNIILFFDHWAIGFDHSIFGGIKSIFHMVYAPHYPARMLMAYTAVTAIFGISLWFCRMRKLPLLNQIVGLCICSLLLPPTSYEYTLLHLYVPWGLMVLYAIWRRSEGHTVDALLPMLVAFALLFSPLNEIIVRGLLYEAQIKCLALMFILAVAMRVPWPGLEEMWIAATKAVRRNAGGVIAVVTLGAANGPRGLRQP